MSTPFDRRVHDNPSTYFVQDRKNKQELTRLKVQDQMITGMMGGVLSEQPDPTVFRRVFDIGCGTGGWIIEAAQTYPEMSLVGIDISQHMIEYARLQAEDRQVSGRVKFHVMDALHTLDFPAGSFDLVNLRFGVSFVRTWDWLKMLSELLRVTRPGGVIRLTESEIGLQSNSPALTQLFEMEQCALFRSGHLFTQEGGGLIDHLTRFLKQYACQQVQTKTYTIEYQAGTAEGEAACENIQLLFQTLRPFIQKWGCIAQDYEAIYQQAIDEMRRSDFLSTGKMSTAWGSKPRPRPQQLQH